MLKYNILNVFEMLQHEILKILLSKGIFFSLKVYQESIPV